MPRVKRAITRNDFYFSYCHRVKKKGIKPVSSKSHFEIIKGMGDVLSNCLLDTGIVGLPRGFGDVLVRDRKVLPSNKYDLTKAFIKGKLVTVMNDHSDQVRKRFYWLSREKKNHKVSIYAFSGCRKLNRAFSAKLQDGKVYPDYVRILNIK